jgi:hypothetical protein
MNQDPGLRAPRPRGPAILFTGATLLAAVTGCGSEGPPPPVAPDSAKPPATASPNLPTTTGTTAPEAAPRIPRFNVQGSDIINGQVEDWGDLVGVDRAQVCEQLPPAFPRDPNAGVASWLWKTGMVVIGDKEQIKSAQAQGKEFGVAFANPVLTEKQKQDGMINDEAIGAASISYVDVDGPGDYVAGALKRGDGDVCVAPIITVDTVDSTGRTIHTFDSFVHGDAYGPYDINPANNTVSSKGGVFVKVPVG